MNKPRSEKIQTVANSHNAGLNDYLSEILHQEAEKYWRERATAVSRERYLQILKSAPDVAPEAFDAL